MKRRATRLSFILTVALWALLAAVPAAAQNVAGQQIYVPNEYIIGAQAGTSLSLVEQAVAKMGASVVSTLPLDDHYLIRMGRVGGRATTYGAHAISSQAVRWVIETIQPNYLYHTCAIPNDEFWNKLWDMKQINMPGAWEIAKGSSRITVAVIDTGVANHPELVGRIVAGYDFIDNDSDPSNDLVGHGTHCSGTIAAQGNNAIGICGVCWNGVKIMPVRVFGTGGTPTSVLIQGEDYALKNGAHVANMSYGGYGDDPAHQTKLAEMAAAGMILCAAAGNDGTDFPHYPSSYPEVISVASVGPYDAIAPYSNYGKIEIAAPGGDSSLGPDATVWSTVVSWNNTTPVYGYAGYEGTSMACPHVAGAAALLLSYNVPAAEVKSRLLTGARPPKSGGMDPTKYGAGILDVQAALANAVMRIVQPGKGATVGTVPDFRISIQGINLATIKIYLDYADLNDDGVPDSTNEGIIIDGTTIYFYLNPARTAVEFNWTDISTSPAMTAGTHNLYVSADATAGGGSVSDWAVFTAARKKIDKGVHLFAFPYDLTNRLTNRTVDTPDKLLPGARFGLAFSPRSTLMRWIAAPRSLADATPVGYDTYNPQNPGERVWTNPLTTMAGAAVATGGGYFYDSVFRQRQFSFPAGCGFWLILPADIWVDESYATLETVQGFDGSKGFDVPLYKGWNMIGNPYAHAVPWRAALFSYLGQTKTLLDAESAGWVGSTIYSYGGSAAGYQRVTDRDLLEPYNGYWLLSLVGGAGQTESLVLTILP